MPKLETLPALDINLKISPFSGECAAALYMPLMFLDRSQIQLSRNFSCAHAALLVLFISINQNIGFTKLVVIQHWVKFLPYNAQSLSVGAVDHHNNELRIGIISRPGCSQALLSAKIPHNKVNIFPNDLLNVRSNGRRGMYNLVHQKLIQDRRFSRIVKSHHNNLVLCKLTTQ